MPNPTSEQGCILRRSLGDVGKKLADLSCERSGDKSVRLSRQSSRRSLLTRMAESSSEIKRLFNAMGLLSVLACILLPAVMSHKVELAPQKTYKYCLSHLSDDDIYGPSFDCSNLYLRQVPSFLPTTTVDLYLYRNLIKELNKDSFKQLSNLKRLNLSDNDISIIRDQSFINLPFLEILDLSFNGIQSIPCNVFAGLQNLKFFRIVDIVNLEFGKCSWNGLKYLAYFEMSLYLNNTITDNFKGLESIDTLRLWVNYKRKDNDPIINNCLDMGLFHTLPHLKLLDLSLGIFYCIEGPSVSHSNAALVEGNGIIHLAIGFNRHLTKIFPGSFMGMSSLQSLDITSCSNITRIDPSAFKGLRKLDRLVLNDGNLHSLDPKQFSELKTLSFLDLVGNIDSGNVDPSAFDGLSNTIYLNLSYGRIRSIEPNTFADFRDLTHLDLSMNNIENIDESVLHGPSKLTYLNLLSYERPINIHPNSFQELSVLKHLCLANDMTIEVLQPLKSLTLLDWACQVFPQSFCGIYLFYYIDASSQYNSLFHWMSSFPNLKKINVFSETELQGQIYPFKARSDSLNFLQISKNPSDIFESISLFVPQNVDLQQHFEEWIKYLSEGNLANNMSKLDVMIPNIIKGALLYADIHSLNLTIPKYLMPHCEIHANEYINVQSLFYNSGSDTMENVFTCFKGLNSLYLNQSIFPLRYIDSDTFSNLESLRMLDMSRNRILFIPETLFNSLSNLAYLNIVQNAFEMDLYTIANLSTLQVLQFDIKDQIYLYSQGCCRVVYDYYSEDLAADNMETWVDKGKCNFDSNAHDDVEYFGYSCHVSYSFCACDPRKIEILNMKRYGISFFDEVINFRSLTSMTAAFMDSYSVDVYVPQLVELDLSYSIVKLNNYHVRFRDVKNIRIARFIGTGYDSRDTYVQCNETTNHIIFQSFVNLEYLTASYSSIAALCQFYFRLLTNLKFLDLSYNEIPFVGKDTFKYNTQLSTINLSHNKITILHPATFEHLTYLSDICFENNPLNCDCDKEYIQKWMTSAKNISFTMDDSIPWQTYTCSEPSSLSGKPFIMIDHHRIACYATQIKLVAIIVLVIPILFVSRIVWKKRWHLLYNAYKKMNKIKQRYPLYFRLEEVREYDFDAFISFSEGDSEWVDEQLQPFMEDELELRLCIHTRDFHGGKDIFTNIEDNIKKSKKIIFIVSENFVRSSYCDFEMRLAFSMMLHALQDERILLFIMLEKVPQKDMSDILKFFVNTKTYLAWPEGDENDDERQHFWQQLKGIVTDEWQIF